MHIHAESAPSLGDPPCFVYGGVAFEVSAAPGLAFELGPDHRHYSAPFEVGPAALAVRVAAAAAPELPRLVSSEIHAEWDGGAGRVRTRGVRAEIRQLGPRSFAASGLVSPTLNGCSSLCTALAGALIDRIGGLVLHASGVEVDGGVVLFVGPSGAGKTTAANHCDGSRAFARDRAAIYPTSAGWQVSPMTGGDVIRLPESDHRVLPLRGILRVVQGRHVMAEQSSLPRAVTILRESAQRTDDSPRAEGALLERLVEIAGEVRVGTLQTVLGAPLASQISAWSGGAK